MHTVTVHRIPEHVVPGKRLGRHVGHDSRSLNYQVRPHMGSVKSVLWARTAPILDQGDLGSCTGNAAAGALGTAPCWPALPVGHPTLNEAEAVALYSAATRLDSDPGAYPPEDTGSDGLSVAQAAKNAGMISGYTHALTLAATQTALQTGPVIVGLNWYDTFDTPASDGTISIGAGAQVRGGHEIEMLGLDVGTGMLRCANSWGTSWGDKGYCQMSFATWERLLSEQGDAVLMLPLTAPAPVPTPTPAPPPIAGPDAVFAAQAQAFLAGRHLFYKAFQADVRGWLAAKGY